jgi:hypothetical protein
VSNNYIFINNNWRMHGQNVQLHIFLVLRKREFAFFFIFLNNTNILR